MTVVNIKKQKVQKGMSKKKLIFDNYKDCLESTQLDNKIKCLKKIKLKIDNLKKVIKNS